MSESMGNETLTRLCGNSKQHGDRASIAAPGLRQSLREAAIYSMIAAPLIGLGIFNLKLKVSSPSELMLKSDTSELTPSPASITPRRLLTTLRSAGEPVRVATGLS